MNVKSIACTASGIETGDCVMLDNILGEPDGVAPSSGMVELPIGAHTTGCRGLVGCRK